MNRGRASQLERAGLGSLLLIAVAWAPDCTRAPSHRFNLESLKVTGNTQLDDAEIEEHIASRETPKFLGLFPGVIYDYEVFNRFVLERDLQRIVRLYQARGYYRARARAARVFRSGSKVRVEIAPGDPAAEGWRKNWVRDIQLMFLRGLFAGGPGSNRGYTSREIGPHGQVPFYNHGQSLESVAMLGSVDCTQPNAKTVHPAVCEVPLGGFTLWEASIELRYPIEGALSGTLFTDAADVSYNLLSFRWRPHLSSGAGLRYDTPVGAIRFDLGFRLPGLKHPPNSPDEGVPNAGIFGLPMAATFGIGEAY